jgi:hypothetical protein
MTSVGKLGELVLPRTSCNSTEFVGFLALCTQSYVMFNWHQYFRTEARLTDRTHGSFSWHVVQSDTEVFCANWCSDFVYSSQLFPVSELVSPCLSWIVYLVPYPRRLYAGCSLRKPRWLHETPVVHEVALERTFLRFLRCPPFSIILSKLHLFCHRPMGCAIGLTKQHIIILSILSLSFIILGWAHKTILAPRPFMICCALPGPKWGLISDVALSGSRVL